MKLLSQIIILTLLLHLYSCKDEYNKADIPKLPDVTVVNTLNIATYNIKAQQTLESESDPKAWINRKYDIAQLFVTHNIDIAGLQDIAPVSQTQFGDICNLLKEYSFVSRGQGDDDGLTGVKVAILFKTERFQSLENGFFFLSPNGKAVPGWDAEKPHICIWAKLRDLNTDKVFFVFNSKFDNSGVNSRIESAKIIRDVIGEKIGDHSVFFTGCLMEKPNNKTYKIVISSLNDAREISTTNPQGNVGTYNAWDMNSTEFDDSKRMDYLFIKGIKVNKYKVIEDKKEIYPSDHFPVLIECQIN